MREKPSIRSTHCLVPKSLRLLHVPLVRQIKPVTEGERILLHPEVSRAVVTFISRNPISEISCPERK